MKTVDLPELITTKALADYFDVSERTAMRWMEAGEFGPFSRIGERGRKVLLRETVLEHLRRKERTR